MADALICWSCSKTITTVLLPLGRRSDCPHCFAELHCCRMCRHFNPDRRPDQCNEAERAEPPGNKDSANFCDWFSLVDQPAGTGTEPSKADAARAQLDALFGGGTDSSNNAD